MSTIAVLTSLAAVILVGTFAHLLGRTVNGKSLSAHGDTELREGDYVTLIGTLGAVQGAANILR